LPKHTDATLTIGGIVNPVPGTYVRGTFAVGTTADPTAQNAQSDVVITAGLRPTATTVSCATNPVTYGGSTSCTATVTDTSGSPTAPTSTASWTTSGSGSFSSGSCTLSGGSSPTTCSVTYTPSAVGAHTITVTYGGDTTH